MVPRKLRASIEAERYPSSGLRLHWLRFLTVQDALVIGKIFAVFTKIGSNMGSEERIQISSILWEYYSASEKLFHLLFYQLL